MNRNVLIGAVLMVVGTALFLPGLNAQFGVVAGGVLVLAAALLTYGTYLVGTSGTGRAV